MARLTLPSIAAAAAALALALNTPPNALAGPQLSAGPAWILGSDDSALGLDAELGFATTGNDIDAFFGLNILYAGLDTDVLSGAIDTTADADYLVAHGVFRLLLPITADRSLKFYGEGGLGATRVDSSIEDLNSLNINEWGMSWSVGAGLDYSFNEVIGFRAGYHHHFLDPLTFGDADISESSFGAVKTGIIIRF